MLGAIIGDTIGSIYEFHNVKTTNFSPLFDTKANYTDDTIMSVAVADWLMNTDQSQESLENKMVYWGKTYPCPKGGYGGAFKKWLFNPNNLANYNEDSTLDFTSSGKRHPYNSFGNGSAMRVSACGWYAQTLEEALDLAKRSAEITHNHPEGIKGAQAVAAAIFWALQGKTKEQIRQDTEEMFGYDLHFTCDELRPTYTWESSCQGTVPPAMVAFLDSSTFEEAIRLAISLGGDSDTMACITGGIAEAYYSNQTNSNSIGITQEMIVEMSDRLPIEMQQIIMQLRKCYKQRLIKNKLM